MPGIIDTGAELLIDRTKVRYPALRLLLAAVGQPVARGSAWVAVSKRVASAYSLPAGDFLSPPTRRQTRGRAA